MIRGVNKQIIEVNETENEYFDKAILFVRASKSDLSTGKLRKQASYILGGMGMKQTQSKKLKAQNIIRILSAAIAGSAVTTIIMLAIR